MKMLRALGLLLAATLLLAACDYKELCYDHRHYIDMKVIFDWQKSPDADVAGMTVVCYSQTKTSAEPVRYDYTGMKGGTAQLTQDTYRAATYNYDTEAILYRNMQSAAALEAYTRQSTIEEGTRLAAFTRGYPMPKARGAEDEPVILEPDPLWATVGSDVELTQAVNPDLITLLPQPCTRHVNITINNVPNLGYTSDFGASLSGLSPSYEIAAHEPGNGAATEAFSMRVSGTSTLTGSLCIFGHCPHQSEDEINQHILTIYAILADGTKWYYSLDITDEMHEASEDPDIDDDEDINIEIAEELPIPKPMTSDSGFVPTIDGWQSIEINVDM